MAGLLPNFTDFCPVRAGLPSHCGRGARQAWPPNQNQAAEQVGGGNHLQDIAARQTSGRTHVMNRIVLPLAIAGVLAALPAVAEEDISTKLAAATMDDKAEVASTAAPADSADSKTPVNGRIIHQINDGEKMCIGGVLCSKFCAEDTRDCEPTRSLTIKLDEPTRINTIQLSAHDNIGKTRRSRLVVKVNGKPVAETLVYKLGSTLSLDVGETGELITIESAHQYNGFLRGGEEAVIWDVYVFGENQS
jgi:hypothetical protein